MAGKKNLFVGIDVGERRHHVTIVNEHGRLADALPPAQGVLHEDVINLIERHADRIRAIGIDAPCELACRGERSRTCERALQQHIGCRIFPTPDEHALVGHWCEEWIRAGLNIHGELATIVTVPVMEVFPTASYTVWCGSRPASSTRASWTDNAARVQARVRGSIDQIPTRWNQHQRDALAAAWTALDACMDRAVEITGTSKRPGIWVPVV